MKDVITIRDREVEYLEPKQWISDCWAWIPCKDPYYLRILEKEMERAGIADRNICLQVPEDLRYGLNLPKHGNSYKSISGGYGLGLNPLVQDIIPFCSRTTIRHEIGHIKFGDLDRKYPPLLRHLCIFFEEIRARLYEIFG